METTTCRAMEHDPVNHPKHYASHRSGVEAIELSGLMPFCEGNAFKYLWRAGEKINRDEDLRKALWYVERSASLPHRRPPWGVRFVLAKLIDKVYRTESCEFKAEALLLIVEAVCCRSRKERSIKLGAVAGIIAHMLGDQEGGA